MKLRTDFSNRLLHRLSGKYILMVVFSVPPVIDVVSQMILNSNYEEIDVELSGSRNYAEQCRIRRKRNVNIVTSTSKHIVHDRRFLT